MKKWHVTIDQNGGEYYGWVEFFADNVAHDMDDEEARTLIVDGRKMVFDERVDFEEVPAIN